jgi:predicted dehydrogenase
MARGTADRLRVGVVGAGYLGSFHAEKYAAMEGVDLSAVVDTDGRRARAVAERCGSVPYGRAEETHGLVDAVSIVVPTSQHHAIAKGFLRRGVDVLIEKPITRTVAEASDLIRTAKRKGCILQVGHLERFNEVWKTIGSALGRPRFIEAHRLGPFQGRGTDVDVILDLMIHDIDIVLKYVPGPIRRIDSVGVPVLSSNVDIANVRIHFQSGTVANLTASRVSARRTRKIRFFQPDAYVSVDYDAGKVQVFRRTTGSEGLPPQIVGDERAVGQGDALRTELEAFVESVRTRKPPEVGGDEGKKALQVALRIIRTMRTA